MPRMSDILANKGDGDTNDKTRADSKKKDKEKVTKNAPLNFPKVILDIDTKPHKEPESCSLISKRLISAVKKHGIDNQEKAREIYENAVETIENLLDKIRLKEDLGPYMDKIYALLDDVFNQLVLGDNILENIYGRKKDKYYLIYHIVNVTVLSTVVGLNMGFNKSRLSHLGLTAIFYDVGLDALKEITGQPRKLTEEEFNLVKTHIFGSLEIIEKIGTIDEVVKETIEMHHERVNGKGYPCGIKSDNINPYAKIIGLVDTYEAITNSRPYHEEMNAHKAMRFLIGSLKNYFDPEVMKTFINKMSVYPIGSIVRLDTQELARVISVQPGSPLRPVVIVIRDASGEPVKEGTMIDLSKQNFPSIQDSI